MTQYISCRICAEHAANDVVLHRSHALYSLVLHGGARLRRRLGVVPLLLHVGGHAVPMPTAAGVLLLLLLPMSAVGSGVLRGLALGLGHVVMPAAAAAAVLAGILLGLGEPAMPAAAVVLLLLLLMGGGGHDTVVVVAGMASVLRHEHLLLLEGALALVFVATPPLLGLAFLFVGFLHNERKRHMHSLTYQIISPIKYTYLVCGVHMY